MRIQINSDKNIGVDDQVIRFVEGEVDRVLKRFADKLTRLEIHLSDVNSDKRGALDKRCVIEARPARHRPLAAIGAAPTVKQAVRRALTKSRNALQTFFGRLEKTARPGPGKSPARKRVAKKAAPAGQTAKRVAATKKVAKKKATASARGPKKKAIYQARRKGWPRRSA